MTPLDISALESIRALSLPVLMLQVNDLPGSRALKSPKASGSDQLHRPVLCHHLANCETPGVLVPSATSHC
jgi:hypothetical protein